ncbi:MAG: DNA polymerase I [Lachnospiraceae bacterium]|nr:DNA polymerase I [Lachnospiraceae bacterium]
MSKKLVLIDGHSILNRAFYGLPMLTNSEGTHTNAVYGFLNILFKILEEEKPDFLAVAFDVHAKTFRHKMYEAYKGTRKPMPEELREQVPLMKEVLRAMHVEILEKEGFEADDVLGTLARKAEAEGIEVALVSGDRDLLQIASDHVKIRIPKTKMGRTEIEDYYAADVKEKLQVTPTQFIELKALMGDTADNIPGVPKVGEKTATELMLAYGSIDGIYAHLDEISKKSIRETLAANRELADLSKVLATIKTDCDLSLDYEKAKAEGYFTPEAYTLFKKLEFKNMLSRFEVGTQTGKAKLWEELVVLESQGRLEQVLLEAIKSQRDQRKLRDTNAIPDNRDGVTSCEIGIQPLIEQGKILAIAISVTDDKVYFYAPSEDQEEANTEAVQLSLFDFMGVAEESKYMTECSASDSDAKLQKNGQKKTNRNLAERTSGGQGEQELRKLLLEKSKNLRLATFDVKHQYDFLAQDTTDRYFDVLIAAYLLNPLKSDYEMDTICSEHLGLMIPGITETFGKKSLSLALQEDPEKVQEYLCSCACAARRVTPVLKEKLKATGMDRLMTEIEMPLTLVLYDMEREGVIAKREELKAYGEALMSRIGELEASIHEKAGKEFNILSPKQLGEILFDDMKLPGGKKTKTGYSTAADVLEKLAPEYPIVSEILEYRGLTKLKSTYADGLASCIAADGRIHTSFNQTITATGRISSTNPNLQNIPMRMELGRRIRKVFVPAKDHVFLDADYSQIELRILAHMSGDQQLIEAYRMDQDIHRITASKVFHVPFEEVTPLQRRNAKAVNFGIVYGISSFGLSQDLSITPKEAAVYIQQYFATYPGIKLFLDACVLEAKEKGYSVTMFGRRRPIPELSSSNFMQRSFGERIAMNSPIQGTAADIIKIAMVKTWKALRNAGMQSKLILQVHDELIIEAKKDEAEKARQILEDCMKSAADLAVELVVDVHEGDNWYDAK